MSVLAISWGNQIELIPVLLQAEFEQKNLNVMAHFVGEFEIIYMKWIAHNMILYIDSRKTIRVL